MPLVPMLKLRSCAEDASLGASHQPLISARFIDDAVACAEEVAGVGDAGGLGVGAGLGVVGLEEVELVGSTFCWPDVWESTVGYCLLGTLASSPLRAQASVSINAVVQLADLISIRTPQPEIQLSPERYSFKGGGGAILPTDGGIVLVSNCHAANTL